MNKRRAKTPFTILRTVLLMAALALFTQHLGAQCPVVGNDNGCDTVITLTDGGVSVSYTAQYGFNFGEAGPESLVGIINNSSQPVSQIGISSSQQIFGFYPGGGIDSYGVSGNSQDTTGYGGPNVFYTGIDLTQSIGLVNFISSIPPFGGTAYFSLASFLNTATNCSSVLSGSITQPVNNGTNVTSVFTPNNGYTLAQAAQACGFDSFDWQQTVISIPSPSPFYSAPPEQDLTAPAPFNDPPPQGYAYQEPTPNNVELPVYYNLGNGPYDLSVAAFTNGNSLTFVDNPSDNSLPAGTYLTFSTQLVGILGQGVNANVVPTGVGFGYNDSYNGTTGGISVLNSVKPVDNGRGTGGITVTNFHPNTTYQYPKSFAITTINGKPAPPPVGPLTLLTKQQVFILQTPVIYDPLDKKYEALVTIQNVTLKAIGGPFQVELFNLPGNITLTNETGVASGSPFLTVSGISTLKPLEVVLVKLVFSNPGTQKVKYSAAVYAGGFN